MQWGAVIMRTISSQPAPTARLWALGMGCPLWVRNQIYVLLLSFQCCVISWCVASLFTALNCICPWIIVFYLYNGSRRDIKSSIVEIQSWRDLNLYRTWSDGHMRSKSGKTFDWPWPHASMSYNSGPTPMDIEKVWRKANKFTIYNALCNALSISCINMYA